MKIEDFAKIVKADCIGTIKIHGNEILEKGISDERLSALVVQHKRGRDHFRMNEKNYVTIICESETFKEVQLLKVPENLAQKLDSDFVLLSNHMQLAF